MANEIGTAQAKRESIAEVRDRIEAAQRAQVKWQFTKPWYVIIWRLFWAVPASIAHAVAVVFWSILFCKRISLNHSWKGEL